MVYFALQTVTMIYSVTTNRISQPKMNHTNIVKILDTFNISLIHWHRRTRYPISLRQITFIEALIYSISRTRTIPSRDILIWQLNRTNSLRRHYENCLKEYHRPEKNPSVSVYINMSSTLRTILPPLPSMLIAYADSHKVSLHFAKESSFFPLPTLHTR